MYHLCRAPIYVNLCLADFLLRIPENNRPLKEKTLQVWLVRIPNQDFLVFSVPEQDIHKPLMISPATYQIQTFVLLNIY